MFGAASRPKLAVASKASACSAEAAVALGCPMPPGIEYRAGRFYLTLAPMLVGLAHNSHDISIADGVPSWCACLDLRIACVRAAATFWKGRPQYAKTNPNVLHELKLTLEALALELAGKVEESGQGHLRVLVPWATPEQRQQQAEAEQCQEPLPSNVSYTLLESREGLQSVMWSCYVPLRLPDGAVEAVYAGRAPSAQQCLELRRTVARRVMQYQQQHCDAGPELLRAIAHLAGACKEADLATKGTSPVAGPGDEQPTHERQVIAPLRVNTPPSEPPMVAPSGMTAQVQEGVPQGPPARDTAGTMQLEEQIGDMAHAAAQRDAYDNASVPVAPDQVVDGQGYHVGPPGVSAGPADPVTGNGVLAGYDPGAVALQAHTAVVGNGVKEVVHHMPKKRAAAASAIDPSPSKKKKTTKHIKDRDIRVQGFGVGYGRDTCVITVRLEQAPKRLKTIGTLQKVLPDDMIKPVRTFLKQRFAAHFANQMPIDLDEQALWRARQDTLVACKRWWQEELERGLADEIEAHIIIAAANDRQAGGPLPAADLRTSTAGGESDSDGAQEDQGDEGVHTSAHTVQMTGTHTVQMNSAHAGQMSSAHPGQAVHNGQQPDDGGVPANTPLQLPQPLNGALSEAAVPVAPADSKEAVEPISVVNMSEEDTA